MFDIRAFAPADLEACYAISLATGFEGGDAAHLYRNPRMMGHIYVAPYAGLDPALALVVEDRDGVAGFAVGTKDTVAWEERLERAWWPSLRRQYADPADIAPEARTPDQRRAHMIHHPEKTPIVVTARFPAHLHLNLLPRAQGQGIGARLLQAWRRRAATPALHVGVNRANQRAVRFWTAQGFEAISFPGAETGRTLWMGRATG